MAPLFHVTGWAALAGAVVGHEFTLVPGPQGAEGVGVYFAEGEPRLSAAEGARGAPAAVVKISVTDHSGWWRTKASLARKHGRPRTWHTAGRSLRLRVATVETGVGGLPVLGCEVCG